MEYRLWLAIEFQNFKVNPEIRNSFQNNKSEKWNAQQRRNFVRYGDIYQGEPYKSYRNVDIGPPLTIAQPQQQVAQQPAAQPQQLYPPIPLPYIPPQAPAQPAQARHAT